MAFNFAYLGNAYINENTLIIVFNSCDNVKICWLETYSWEFDL